jgi:hypothetical protein
VSTNKLSEVYDEIYLVIEISFKPGTILAKEASKN